MANSHSSVIQLALDLRRGSWLIKDPGILMPVVNAFFNRDRIALDPLPEMSAPLFRLSSDGERARNVSKEEENHPKVAVIPIHCALTKYETCENYGTTQFAAKISKFLEDATVVGFVLDIDSPGGCVNAIPPLVEAIGRIKAAGKPVIAHCDACYSAAYWIASQCDAVFADNETSSGLGSIGAYVQILDDREDKSTGFKVITVYAPESKDKNLAYREALDGRPEKMQAELSRLVQAFHAAVKAGRPALKADAEGVLSGAEFTAQEAVTLGLADGIASLDECIRNVFIRAEFN